MCLGRGSYGDVWLEIMDDEPDIKKVVKAIRIKNVWSGVDMDYTKEVKAMLGFSKVKVCENITKSGNSLTCSLFKMKTFLG